MSSISGSEFGSEHIAVPAWLLQRLDRRCRQCGVDRVQALAIGLVMVTVLRADTLTDLARLLGHLGVDRDG